MRGPLVRVMGRDGCSIRAAQRLPEWARTTEEAMIANDETRPPVEGRVDLLLDLYGQRFTTLEADLRAFRTEMHAELRAFRAELVAEGREGRTRLGDEVRDLQGEVRHTASRRTLVLGMGVVVV